MLRKLEECGIDRDTGMEAIGKRKDECAKALNEYKRKINESKSNDGY